MVSKWQGRQSTKPASFCELGVQCVWGGALSMLVPVTLEGRGGSARAPCDGSKRKVTEEGGGVSESRRTPQRQRWAWKYHSTELDRKQLRPSQWGWGFRVKRLVNAYPVSDCMAVSLRQPTETCPFHLGQEHLCLSREHRF